MPYPTPDAHLAATGRHLEIQTEKVAFKIVPCTFADCDCDLVVNTFYAPYKGKCSQHNGKSSGAVVASHLVTAVEGKATLNGALAKVLCPMCQMPMLVKDVSADGRRITLTCTDGIGKKTMAEVEEGQKLRYHQDGYCGTSVQVRLDWSAMEMGGIRTEFAKFAAEFNMDAKLKYFDHNEARYGTPTA